ncbi:MAG: hypothetical protein Q8K55_06460 [Gemmatimonadaceae bacterium]|nr:hypothetical protein [Gemmatimonadaceae bacterium]
MPDDGWLIFALGVVTGCVFGWLAHALYVALWDATRYALSVARRLYGWHRARDSRRLAALEAQILQQVPRNPTP